MPLLEKWTPMRDLDLIDRRMRRFFGDVGLGFVPAVAPAADVYETERELVVELEVPGFDEKELEIEVSDHTLAIAGERTEEAERTERALRVHERLERKFERRFDLPLDVDTEHVSAAYVKGVLTVKVPRTGRVEPHRVEIAT